MSRPSYSVDTSALIDGLERFYPSATFNGLWDAVDQLISDGRLYASEEVWEEIKKRDEVVKAWADPRRDEFIVPTTASLAKGVQNILDKFPRLAMSGGRRDRADPWVIAVAIERGGIVVTGEVGNGSPSKPKIPYVCEQLGVRCIRFTDLIAEESWRFELSET